MKETTLKRLKQILAIIAIIILLSLYIVTFIFAILDKPYANRMFNASLYASFFVPITIYVLIWFSNLLKDMVTPNENNETEKKSFQKDKKEKLKDIPKNK